jgi:hypothetical protein
MFRISQLANSNAAFRRVGNECFSSKLPDKRLNVSAYEILKTDMCHQSDTHETRNKQTQKKIKVIRKNVTKRDKTWMNVT